jgi:hypothetical protein
LKSGGFKLRVQAKGKLDDSNLYSAPPRARQSRTRAPTAAAPRCCPPPRTCRAGPPPAPWRGSTHKHERRLDGDEIKPRHWFTRAGLANGRHAKLHTTLPMSTSGRCGSSDDSRSSRFITPVRTSRNANRTSVSPSGSRPVLGLSLPGCQIGYTWIILACLIN